ncbi:TetR/AcrR family transcriptional regulator [Deferribacterales bacterium Es71-Z0220]|uniref:TetR/AcrR family transcriptional regulator n=1 Tax=Deferrivibrio essentukiensis TaxID=2880922 RepID=UPI001F60E723|nr:TetR/AcrR family transcriptional regulator [Deferrivibrio essentukiensis]MCB4205177.1 TetR/AcrR family transcriptional regulator [Deferrivibrio essentukiensis]
MSTKEKIIDAAFGLFSQKGYLGTTTKEIALHAGVSEVTLFRHFVSKESIFEEVIQSKSFLPDLKNLIPKLENLSLKDTLLEIATENIKKLIMKKGAIKIFFSEVDRYPERVRESHNAMVDEMVRILTKFLMSKLTKYSDKDMKLITKMFWYIIFGYFLENEIIKNEVSDFDLLRKIFDRKIDFFLNGIL